MDLSRLKEELHKLVALLQLELRHVRPLLVRFCLTRGFWRLAHALVTGYFGGAIDQRDGSLAAVAVHPLTSSMADSIAEIAFQVPVPISLWAPSAPTAGADVVCGALQLDHLTVLPRAVLSRIERKGKFLQLILHSLTVDNTGNAGALSVLAACVMTTHFILIWSRKDFESLVCSPRSAPARGRACPMLTSRASGPPGAADEPERRPGGQRQCRGALVAHAGSVAL